MSKTAVKEQVGKIFTPSFKQQELKSCVPLYRPISVILFFLITGIIFIPIGVTVYVVSNNCVEYSVMYYGEGSPVKCEDNSTCEFTFEITEPVKTPVYVYYQLTNFYQNHREYLRSRSNAQLKGNDITEYSQLTDCAPLVSVNDSKDVSMFYEPCGLVAHSYFNDTFELTMTVDGKEQDLELNKNNINWKSDKKLFENPKQRKGVEVIDDYADPDFINWMRPAVSSTFRKLTGVIDDVDQIQGNITISVENNFPVSSFGGTKSIILATTSIFGTKNPALGMIYMITGIIFVLVAVMLFVMTKLSPRKFADKRFLRW